MITEADIATRIGREVPEPIRVFNAFDAGIDFCQLAVALEKTWAKLSWDWYDVRHRQLEIIDSNISSTHLKLPASVRHEYYVNGETALFHDVLSRLPESVGVEIDGVQPFRRRAIANYVATTNSGGWKLKSKPVEAFSMEVSDVRRIPRCFDPICDSVSTNLHFRGLIEAMLNCIRDVRPVACINVVAHQVSTVARPNERATNSPEGVHQDGCDFIVSAFVISRDGVAGGESRLYFDGEQLPFFSHRLASGEGIFQVDAGSRIFHEVTPISSGLPSSDDVHRNTIGLDFHIVE